MSGASESVLEALARALDSTTPSAPTSSTSPAPHTHASAASWRQDQAARPARSAVDPRRDHRRRRVRGQRAPRHPRRQPARTRAVLRAVPAPARPVNTARFVFLDPRAEASYGDWDRVATESVAILRSAAGRDPYNRDLSDLVGELATQSEAFRTRWAAHNVRFHNTGVKHFNHPDVGELHLSYNRLDLAADPGLTIFTYTAEPGSRSDEALKLLGSWAATVDPAESARDRPKLRPTTTTQPGPEGSA